MQDHPSFDCLSDLQLTETLSNLARRERESTVDLLACLSEFDQRRLYLGLGYTSIFAYCKDALHLADGAAYKRISVARTSRRFPAVLDMVRDGRLSLSTACLLAPKLQGDTVDGLLREAAGKPKRDVELILARRAPRPPVPSVIRKLPASTHVRQEDRNSSTAAHGHDLLAGVAPLGTATLPDASPAPPSRRPVVAPLSEAHYKLQVTISTSAHDRLRNIQNLMRHANPSGDAAVIVERALEVLEADLLKKKAAAVAKPRAARHGDSDPKGRHITASVLRAVWKRDQARCAFVGNGGKKCGSPSGLEFHHVRPFAVGGGATVDNIELRCRAHNTFEWERHLDKETASLAGP